MDYNKNNTELEQKLNAINNEGKKKLSAIGRERTRLEARREFIQSEIAFLRKHYKNLGVEYAVVCDKAKAVNLDMAKKKLELEQAFDVQRQERGNGGDCWEDFRQSVVETVTSVLDRAHKADRPKVFGFKVVLGANGDLNTTITVENVGE